MKIERITGHSVVTDCLRTSSIVVDLGSNRGDFASEISQRFGCIVHCVEPNPKLFAELTKNPQLRSYNVAIGTSSERLPFYVTANSECSSLSQPTISPVEEVIECASLTLKDFLDANCIERIDLLKIDIEGAELTVLCQSSAALMDRISQITVEFHDSQGLGSAIEVRSAIRCLEQHGFRAVRGSFSDYSDVLFVHPGRMKLYFGWSMAAHFWTIRNGFARRAQAGIPAFFR